MPLSVEPVTRDPAPFSTGTGSPVIIDSSTLARPLEDDAVHRHLLAGADAEAVARPDVVEGHVGLGAVGGEAPGGLRGEAEQGLDGAARPLARARSSSTWPIRTRVTITAADSK